jgi:serine/threonine protein kinase
MVGEYRIEGPLSENDMGTTYAAIHPLIRKRVAIRVLHQRYAEDHRAVSRFVMEARAVNEIGHHNIVDVLSIGELSDGRNYLVMELLEGLGLHDILRRQKRLQPGELLPLFEQICDALDAVHAASFIHRDLKPENIVVLRRPPRPFVKIQDFGMAKLKGQGESETDVATLVGTPVYMAPEHSMGDGIDARADIYSLGVILYELLTGKPPYPAQALLQAFEGKGAPRARPPSELTSLSAALDQVVLKAMAWDREKRFPTVLALWNELRPAVAEPLPWTISLEPLAPEPAPDPAPVLARPPLARPPAPLPISSSLAPESIDGDLGEDELRTRQADRKILHVRPDPQAEDEEPTDIFPGAPALDGAHHNDLAPISLLGVPDEDELGEDDTEVSDGPLASTNVVERRAASSRTLVGVGPTPPVDDDTQRQAALVDSAEPIELDEATVKPVSTADLYEVEVPADEELEDTLKPTAPHPKAELPKAAEPPEAAEPPRAAEPPKAVEPPEAAAPPNPPDEDDYCSFEIIADPPDNSD